MLTYRYSPCSYHSFPCLFRCATAIYPSFEDETKSKSVKYLQKKSTDQIEVSIRFSF